MRRYGALLGSALLLAGAGCGGEPEAAPQPPATWLQEPLAAVRTSTLSAGARAPDPEIQNPYSGDQNAVAQGRQLYDGFNCSGCHGSAGGGGMGPPLADEDWIYGNSDAQIYASVVQGRPNGMPSFGQSLTGEAVWKLAAYVKSLGPGTGENQEGGQQAAGSEGGGKQAAGRTSD